MTSAHLEERSGRFRRWLTAAPSPLLILAVVVAVVPPLVLWTAHIYTGTAVWPGLVGNMTGGLVAFVLALEWDRRRDVKRAVEAAHQAGVELAEDARQAEELRRSEAQRRLRLVLAELERNEERLEDLMTRLARQETLVYPLTGGAWAASAEALARLLANPEIVERLSNLYALAGELGWLLHLRAEAVQGSEANNQRTRDAAAVAHEVRTLLHEVVQLVRNESGDPKVQLSGRVSATDVGIRIAGV